jgi:hypothetical protein
MSFKITAESDLWESRGTFTLARLQLLNIIFSRERSSTGSNDCFVVLVLFAKSLFWHFVPSRGT